MPVVQAEQTEAWVHLPRVPNISLKTVVGSQAAAREAEGGLGRRETNAIAQEHPVRRVGGWIDGPGSTVGRAHLRVGKEGSQTSALKMIKRGSVAKYVLADHLAAVVLNLVVALNCLLRRQQVGSTAIGATLADYAIPRNRRTNIYAQARDGIIRASRDA